MYSQDSLSDAFFLANIREIWKAYDLKKGDEMNIFIDKQKDLKYQAEHYNLKKLQ